MCPLCRPIRRALLRAFSGDVLLPTDQYCVCLDGTWNADGDANWGELASPSIGEPGDDVDFVPDVNLGRAAARHPQGAPSPVIM